MSRYGFKVNNTHDRQAITNLMLQQGQIMHHRYNTLAQYEIKDVQLKPTNLGFGRPRRWTLTFDTNLVGMNMPNGEALWFAKEGREVGDGYSTLDLDVDQFTQMLKGGLYVNPQKYLERLSKKLTNQTFYRTTKANLMTIDVPGDALTIAAGDFSGRVAATHRYLVGADLQSYSNVESSQKTNLIQLVNRKVADLGKQPITEVAQLQVPDDLSLASDQMKASLLDKESAPAPTNLMKQLRQQMVDAKQALNRSAALPKQESAKPTTFDTNLFAEEANNEQTSRQVKRSSAVKQEASAVSTEQRPKSPAEFHKVPEQGVQMETRPESIGQVSPSSDQPVGQSANQPANFADLMASLQEAAGNDQPVSDLPKRAYVDDFAQAAQSSHQSQLNNKRQRVTKNEPALDQKPKSSDSSAKTKEADDGLSF